MVHYQIKKKTLFSSVFLFHFADSNQTRQRKRKKIRDLKKKQREKTLQYNSAEEDKIDEELACSLTEDYILPWERLGDGMVACLVMFSKMYSHMPMV